WLAATTPASSALAATADENFRTEHEIGQRYSFDPHNLPPQGGAVANNGPNVVPYVGQVPTVPPGFTATLWGSNIARPRRLLALPSGDGFVAQQFIGRVSRLRDDSQGHAVVMDFIDGFQSPYGLAWRDNELLVTDLVGIWRVPGGTGQPQLLTANGVFGEMQG